MLKIKFLHRKTRKPKWSTDWSIKKFQRGKNIYIFDDLPFHQPIRSKYSHRYSNYDATPMYKFIESKIGEKWNDIYSEILKKLKFQYKRDIVRHIHSYRYNHFFGVFLNPIYDDDFIPRNEYGTILRNYLFVDENGFLVRKSEQQIISDAKKIQRRIKLKNILENSDIDFEEFDQYDDYLISDAKMRMKKYKRN